MVSPRRSFFAILGLLTIVSWGVVPQPVSASRSDYFDFGPYYQPPVLGLSLSSLEHLPPLNLPAEIMPQAATGILPDSPLYNFEKVFENAQLTFTFDPVAKEGLRLKIAEERLSEAKTLIGQGKVESGATALSDYRQTMADVATHLPSLSAGGPAAREFINKVEGTVAAHAVVATSLSLVSPPQQAEIWTKAAGAGKNLLDSVAEAKGEPAIPEDLSTGIQKLKEEGLISEEESNKLYSFKNRSEVRDELEKLATSGTFPVSELSKMDTAFGKHYPEAYGQYRDNLQVVELRGYQGLPQPSAEVIEELEDWQENPDVSPPNSIKPYLWYNRAQSLAMEVDLSNFSADQQADLANFYPVAISGNATYSPLPSPTPEPDQTSSEPSESDQSVIEETDAEKADEKAEEYLGETGGALPGETAYFFKQFGEQAQYFFALNPADKAKLKMQYAERRLAEARQLAEDPNKASVYESTLRAYKQAMDDASAQLKQAVESEDAEGIAKDLENQAARHEAVLEKGLLPTPVKNPEIIKEAITATEDAMDRSADALNRPALPPVLSSRLEDLKAQGLILSEEVEDLTRSGSREEVREKVRKLVELGSFPPADAKKLDEAQTTASPSDYIQLVEVRKVEELQGLRSVQTEIAQTPALRNTAVTLGQREAALVATIDPSVIKEEDLGGRADLISTYQALAATASARPLNSGQFGLETESGPGSARASGVCPEGAVFNQSEGCVWADSGKNINDYDQYRCDGPRQYYSFVAEKCLAYDPTEGFREDSQPACPVGYTWSWYAKGCQEQSGSLIPTPSPEPEPEDEAEIAKINAERSKYCPEGASYKIPRGCVWDDNDEPLYDPGQYRCGREQYYSFNERKCVAAPKEGEPYPEDVTPACREQGSFWSWSDGKCIPTQVSSGGEGTGAVIGEIRPSFATPDSPFYFLKTLGENIQETVAFSPEAKEQVRLAHARERLAEGLYALEKGDRERFKTSVTLYTSKVQEAVNDLSRANVNPQVGKQIGEHLEAAIVEHNLILQKASALAGGSSGVDFSAANSAIILGVDRAADLKGEDPIPTDLREKIENLSTEMISEEDKKKVLESGTRVEARLAVGDLSAKGLITVAETAYLNDEFKKVDPGEQAKIDELRKLAEIVTVTKQKIETEEKVEKNEEIVQKIDEFQRTFEAGKEIPADVRPYIRLTRIEEVAQTVRPDIVRIGDFRNRKDLVLAVATLQQEYKPTRQDVGRVEEFRRRNPNAALPLELARIEALAYSLGVRDQAGPCFLPSPPFPSNTPCPAPGAAIPIASYTNYTNPYPLIVDPVDSEGRYIGGYGNIGAPSLDKDGNPLVYGQGPKPTSPGVCQSGYHWMYDSGGWCMANEGSYGNYGGSNTPSGYGSGYTPYSPYYTAPGAPPATSGYPVGDTSPNDGCPYGSDSDGRGNCIPNSYPASSYGYAPPSYWGAAPTTYTTNPPAGTVPGSGPRPTSPGQCPSGYHWMSDSGGWCMADSGTYVPSSSYPGSYYSPNLTKSSCGPGYYWDGKGCIPTYSGSGSGSGGSTPWCWSAFLSPEATTCGSGSSWDGVSCSCKPSGSTSGTSGSYTPSSYQYGCTPGSYWDGGKCVKGSYEGPGWSDSAAQSGNWCQAPSGGCGSGKYWDYGSCSCRTSSVSSGDSSSGSTTSGGSSSGSCPTGSHWMSENGGYCMSDSAPSGSSGGSTSSGGGSSSVSCPSGYHLMDNSWCMSDAERDSGSSGGSTSTSTTTSEPAPSEPSTSSEPAPATSEPASEPAP